MAKKKTRKKGENDDEVQQAIVTPREMNSFYAWEGETLILNILGTPSAKRDAIDKVKGIQLCISVREAP